MCQTWKYKTSLLGGLQSSGEANNTSDCNCKLGQMLWGQSISGKVSKSHFSSELSLVILWVHRATSGLSSWGGFRSFRPGLFGEVQAPHPGHEHGQKQSLKVHPVGRKDRRRRGRKGNHHCFHSWWRAHRSSQGRETRNPQNARGRRSILWVTITLTPLTNLRTTTLLT